jgi:hypothetical protein
MDHVRPKPLPETDLRLLRQVGKPLRRVDVSSLREEGREYRLERRIPVVSEVSKDGGTC